MKRSFILCLSTLLACSSAALARPHHNDQQATERPRRVELPSFLGVELSEVSRETVNRLKLREERGALIDGVTSGSSAAQAGLQKNDVIVKWDGEPIESAREMSRHIRETPAGRAVRLTVIRDGREMDVNVTLGERSSIANRVRVARPAFAMTRVRPDVPPVRRVRDRRLLGVELQSMTPQLAEYFGLSKRSGALVIFVFADSPAAKAGLKAGDVILSAGGESVQNPYDLRRVLTDKADAPVEFKVLRDKQEQTMRVQLEKGTGSWLMLPDDGLDSFDLALSPLTVTVPKIKLAPMPVRVPAVTIKPATIKPMKLQMPKIQVTPMAIPPIKLEPMSFEIPKLQIEPMKFLVVPRRIIL